MLDALEERDQSNGQVSASKIKDLLSSFQQQILDGVDSRLAEIRDSGIFPRQESGEVFPVSEVAEGEAPTFGDGKYFAFCYAEDDNSERRFWQVPKGFQFPKADRHAGWKFWMLGIPDHTEKRADGTVVAHPISPFRLFQDKMLPKSAKTVFKVNWKPVFDIMESAIVSGASSPFEMTSTELEEWYSAGTDMLRFRASYCFAKPRHERWGVSTWSRKVQPSQIRKYGTTSDIIALPAPESRWSSQNRKARLSKGRKRQHLQTTLHPRRRRRSPRNGAGTAQNDPEDPQTQGDERDVNANEQNEEHGSSGDDDSMFLEENPVAERAESDNSDEEVMAYIENTQPVSETS